MNKNKILKSYAKNEMTFEDAINVLKNHSPIDYEYIIKTYGYLLKYDFIKNYNLIWDEDFYKFDGPDPVIESKNKVTYDEFECLYHDLSSFFDLSFMT